MIYYNENDPQKAAWLRELMRVNAIAPGVVDERSIKEIRPEELAPYVQCHFFAGIGAWSYALRTAGWADDRPVWTGSCPCQPFSVAGEKGGFDDARHLWPEWHRLIAVRRPDVIFGEQVGSKGGLGWLDLVRDDMEGSGYALGAVDHPAAGYGAPHIRQRLYWVADAATAGLLPSPHPGVHSSQESFGAWNAELERQRGVGGVADASGQRRQRWRAGEKGDQPGTVERFDGFCDAGGLAYPNGGNPGPERQQRSGEQRQQQENGGVDRMGHPRSTGLAGRPGERGDDGAEFPAVERAGGDAHWLEHPPSHGRLERGAEPGGWGAVGGCGDGEVGHPQSLGREWGPDDFNSGRGERPPGQTGEIGGHHHPRPSPVNGFWSNADWLRCTDGKWRPVESPPLGLADGLAADLGYVRDPGTGEWFSFPLIQKGKARVARLRGYGDAIVAAQAQAFIEAYMEVATGGS